MGSPRVSVKDFFCQGSQAGILRVSDEELQIGGQQQALQQATGISWSVGSRNTAVIVPCPFLRRLHDCAEWCQG